MGKTVRKVNKIAKKKTGNTTKQPQDHIVQVKDFTKKTKVKSIQDVLTRVNIVSDEVKKIRKKKADADRRHAKKYGNKKLSKSGLPESLRIKGSFD